MTDRERFKAIVNFERPDYVPIFSFPGAPGMGNGCMEPTRKQLIEQGMPEWVGAEYRPYQSESLWSWQRYWGTTGPVFAPGSTAIPGPGIKCEMRIEDGFEIIECETGARTRQVINNDNTYIMPDFQSFHVRDRKSWEFYRERTEPRGMITSENVDVAIANFNSKDRPVAIGYGSTYGHLRGLMGPAVVSFILYDDPELIREIMQTQIDDFEKYTIPLIERIRPDILATGEDCCYNHGMLLSPKHFREFCAPFYRRVCEVAKDCNVDMVAIDTDGNAMELVPIVEECGVNAIFPFEVKAGNDLFALRECHPRFILMGWLEKEVVNEGNCHLIHDEIMSKVPPLLEKGGYFPNGDHGIQPLVTFDNLCRFMTLLHEVTGNPEGEFPRIQCD
jgi:hypothetical protein